MDFWVQYHNAEKEEDLPGDFPYNSETEVCTLDTTFASAHTISTSKSDILGAIGDVVFMIVGFGSRKRRYALWSWTLLEDVLDSDGPVFDALGDCAVLNPPHELEGQAFAEFKKYVGNFGLGFQKVSNHPYLDTLIRFAVEGTGVDHSSVEFTYLAGNIPDASELLESEGKFEPPEGEAEYVDRVLREVASRRGQPQFREELLNAYSGRCVITGTTVDAVLEAAHIIPVADTPFFDVTNGLLLRADVHALFDTGLIWIDPETRVIRIHDALVGTEYESYNG